jgi:hypothetical protein
MSYVKMGQQPGICLKTQKPSQITRNPVRDLKVGSRKYEKENGPFSFPIIYVLTNT